MAIDKIWTWDELDVHTVTNLFLYGREETPVHYVDRLRSKDEYDSLPTITVNNQSFQVLTIQIDAVSFMSSGPGKYASPSQASVVQQFFDGLLTLPEGVYTRAQLQQPPYGIHENDFKISLAQYELQTGSLDYALRTYVFNNGGFILSDDTEFIVTSTGLAMDNIKIRPFDDNFDFKTDGFFANLADYLVLESEIDPYAIGVKLDFVFANLDQIQPIVNYNYIADTQTYANNVDGSLYPDAYNAMVDVVDTLKTAGTIEYATPSGGQVVYGSALDDVTVTGTVYGDIIVAGDGDDYVLGTEGDDVLYGGGHDDLSTNDTLSYEFIKDDVDVSFTAAAQEGTNYTKGLNIVGYDFSFSQDAYGFEKLILTNAKDRVNFEQGDIAESYTIDGSGGTDVLDFSQMLTGVILRADLGEVGAVSFSRFEHFIGSETGADHFYGGALGALYDGRGGEDTMDYSHLLDGSAVGYIIADMTEGRIEKYASSFTGGSIQDEIKYIEKIKGSNGDDFFRSKEGLVGISFDGGSDQTSGGDVVDFSLYQNGVTVSLSASLNTDALGGTLRLSDIETVYGSGKRDVISGSGASEWLFGRGGNDEIEGGGDNDHLIGDAGDDALDGGGGDDSYYYFNTSHTDMDTIADSSGTDTIKLYGGFKFKGEGFIERSEDHEVVTIEEVGYVENSDDIEFVEYVDGARFAFQDLGLIDKTHSVDNVLTTLAGNETFLATDLNDVIGSSSGNDQINGGAGFDFVSYENSSFAVNINLENGFVSKGNSGPYGALELDNLLNVEGVIGTDYNDTLIGNEFDNSIHGGEGDDNIAGGEGNDHITSDGLNNTIYGGLGNDWIYASGNIYGDEGVDHLYGSGLLYGGADTDFLYGTGILFGGAGNDYLQGTGDGVVYIASQGTDVIWDDGDAGVLEISSVSSLDGLTFEQAENKSLIITTLFGSKYIIIDHFSSSPLEYIRFSDSGTLIEVPRDGVKFQDSIFDQSFAGSAGDDFYTGGTTVKDVSISSMAGDNVYEFDIDTYLGDTSVSSSGAANETISLLDTFELEDISAVRQTNSSNMTINYGGGTISLQSVFADDASADNFIIKLGNSSTSSLYNIAFETVGNHRNNTIYGDVLALGFSKNDTIRGMDGNDTIYAGLGNDIVHGGDNNDIIRGGAGDDILYGDEGDDNVDGQDGYDLIYDGTGNDTYHARTGDILFLGAGDNNLVAQESDQSGFKIDLTNYSFFNTETQTVELYFSRDFSGNQFSGYKLAYGSHSLTIGDDVNSVEFMPTVMLDGGYEVLLSSLTVRGYGTEEDESYNEFGRISVNDFVYAGDGNDDFSFMNGDDVFFGGDGNDFATKFFSVTYTLPDGTVIGNPPATGTLTAYGEGGDDYLGGGVSDDYLDGGDGNDALNAIFGGADMLIGGAGDDSFLLDSDGLDSVDGGEGNDTIIFSSANMLTHITAAVAVSLEIDLENQVAYSREDNRTFIFSGIENAIGTDRNDIIRGDSNDNIISGDVGDDELYGGAGNDMYSFNVREDEDGFFEYWNTDLIQDTGGLEDVLLLEGTSQESNYSLEQVGLDLVLHIGDGAITIKNQFFGNGEFRVENLIFFNPDVSAEEQVRLDLVNYESWYTPYTPGGPPIPDTSVFATDEAEDFDGDVYTIDEVNYSLSTAPVEIDLSDWWGYGGFAEDDFLYSIENIIGSDLSWAGDYIIGNDDINTLYGLAGNDILGGGAGNDFLFGGDGDDTYLFEIGDGINVIVDTSGFDTIELGENIYAQDITYTQMDNDLLIQIASGFLIKDFYSGNADDVVEQIKFSDDSTFDLTTLLSSNAAPTAEDDVFEGDQNAIITGNVLNNDTDLDDDVLSVVAGIYATANGSVDIAANGDFIYTPNADYIGTDSFSYTVEDGQGGSDAANVNLTINEIDLIPFDPIVNGVDGANNLADPAALLNGLDEITVAVWIEANAINQDKGIFDTEAQDGQDDTLTMRYDANGYYGGGTNVIKVAVNTTQGIVQIESSSNVQTLAPQQLVMTWKSGEALKLYIDGIENTPSYASALKGGVISGITDLIIGGGAYGTWNGHIDGFQIYDVALDAQQVAQLTAEALQLNADPITYDDVFVGDQDTVITGNVLVDNGNGADRDPDADALSVVAGTYATQHGSVNILATGDFTYTPDAGYAGADSFSYTVEDGQGGSHIGNVSLSLNDIYDIPPIANDDSVITDENVPVIISVLDNDTDADNDPLSVSILTNAAKGTLVVNSDKTITYTPNANAYGTDSFTYKIDDGRGGTANATVSVNIINWVVGNSSNNTLYGTAGLDHLQGLDGFDTLYGSAGSDILDGGSSTDVVTYANMTAGVNVDLALGTATDSEGSVDILLNIENITGSSYDDTLSGASGSQTISGRGGNDTLYGLDGHDTLYGGEGHDTLYGGNTHDILHGENGNDILYGEADSDTLYGNAGDDQLYGGAGNDTLYGFTGFDLIDGGDGTDNVHYGTSTASVEVNLTSGIANKAGNETDTITNIENVTGSAFADTLIGSNTANVMIGGAGNDILRGEGGNDNISGYDDNDMLYGGAGVDSLTGGNGADTFVFEMDTAFLNVDNVHDFNIAQSDKIDISDLLAGYDPLADAITDFVQITNNQTNSYLAVDVDGGANNFVRIATLLNVTGLTDEEALVGSGNLMVA